MFGAPVSHRAVVPVVVALLTAAVVVPGTVDAQERTSDDALLDQLQGDWVRVESNNPRNDGMRIRVEGGRATITAMPPRGSGRFRVGQVVWDDVSADGSLAVRGSDGASYPSKLTMEGTNRLHLDIDLENSPGNDQTWERAGPSIDGDWVLYYTLEAYEQNRGIRVRVEGDRATIRYVPPTADRGFRVGDIIWREFSPSDHSSAALYLFESLFDGSTYEPARMSRSTRYEDGGIRSIRVSKTDTRTQLWGRPEKAEEVFAEGIGEDEDEGALLDFPLEPVGDPSAEDPDLEPSDDMKTVDLPTEEQALAAWMQQTGAVTGEVFHDLDGNGTRDVGEPGLPGVTLVTEGMYSGDRSTLTTDADGRYRLEVTGPIATRISVDEPSLPFEGALTTRLDEHAFNKRPGSFVENADFGYREEEMGVVTGLVFHDRDEGEPGLPGGEPGLPGVTVVGVDSDTGDGWTATTDADGRYTLEIPGDVIHRVSVDASSLPVDGLTSLNDEYHDLLVPAGFMLQGVDFGFRWTADLVTGFVLRASNCNDENAEFLGGVTVVVEDGDSGARSTLTTYSEPEIDRGYFEFRFLGGVYHRFSVDESSLPFDGVQTDASLVGFGMVPYSGEILEDEVAFLCFAYRER